MKVNKSLFFALAAGTALLSSCSSDDNELVPSVDNEGAVQEIVLQVANGGDGLVSRAGRPLYSSEAKQSIENVVVFVCDKNNKILYKKAITEWNKTGSTEYTQNGHGRQTTITIPKAEKVSGTEFKIYAIGYHNTSDYDGLDAITSLVKEGTFTENTKLTLSKGIGEEIFAGSATVTIPAGTGFKANVILNRQVAGAFGYLEDIPYVQDATTLKLVASSRNKGLVLGHFANNQIPSNGGANPVNFVINGTDAVTSADEKVIYTIDLTQWFAQVQDSDNDGLVDIDSWKNALDNTNKDTVLLKKGAVLGANFVIPFAKSTTTETNTFELQLCKATGEVVRTWVVKLPLKDQQVDQPHSVWSWGTTWTETQSVKDTQNNYSIVRNHLYGIGKRDLDVPTKPGEPDPNPQPDPDKDKPESLNNKQELILQVNDNWELIHGMELD